MTNLSKTIFSAIIILIAAMTFTSCGSSSATTLDKNPELVRARVQEAFGMDYKYTFTEVEIKWVSKYHKTNDIINLNGTMYKVIEIFPVDSTVQCHFEYGECPGQMCPNNPDYVDGD